MSAKAKWLWRVMGVIVLVYPVVMGNAAEGVTREQRGEELLETFPVGQAPGFYWDALRQRGYRIIEEKVNTSDRLEIEAAKPDHAIVLVVQFDEESDRSTGVVAYTLWSDRGDRARAAGEVGREDGPRTRVAGQDRR